MSYNIDNVDCEVLNAFMRVTDVRRLLAEHEGDLPEVHFLGEMKLPNEVSGGPHFDEAIRELRKHDKAAADRISSKAEKDGKVALPNFWWYGEGSGGTFDFLKEAIAPLIEGEVVAVFTWEGGDSVTGLRIKDGVVEEMDVEQKLVPKKKKKKTRRPATEI